MNASTHACAVCLFPPASLRHPQRCATRCSHVPAYTCRLTCPTLHAVLPPASTPQGRFFAGRSVRVSFFPEERFTSTDLAPKQGEFD